MGNILDWFRGITIPIKETVMLKEAELSACELPESMYLIGKSFDSSHYEDIVTLYAPMDESGVEIWEGEVNYFYVPVDSKTINFGG